MNKSASVSPGPPAAPAPESKPRSVANPVFIGPNGLRAGWRLLIFLLILQAWSIGLGLLLRLFHVGNPNALSGVTSGVLYPLRVGRLEGGILFFVCITTWIMAKIEHRKFGDYGLPFRSGLQKDFWEGGLWGFLGISGTLLAIFALHGFRITGLAIHGTTILGATASWCLVFLLVGLSEEFTFRGYAQFTLTTGIGFWPSAFLLSGAFAAVHMGNAGETKYGLLSVVVFGLLFCLVLRRTGDLWWAVGFHAGWDWGQTFFYGVHDSGLAPYHNLLSSQFFGPAWLTGGTVGPEASIFTPLALGIVALLFSLKYREARYRPGSATMPART
jgi:membrane protease YdiL (CAAX protease family)